MSADSNQDDFHPGHIEEGDKVAWNWGTSHMEGVVAEKYTGHVSKTIKGKQVARNGTEDNPAYFVMREDGKMPVLKKESELHQMNEGEHVPSNQHVETARQRALHAEQK